MSSFWSALASTTAASISALATLLMHDLLPRVKDVSSGESLQYGKYLTVVVGVLGLLLSLPKILTMLQMLIFLGVINAAFIFPIVLGLWSEKTNPNGVFVAAIVATIGGYVVYFTVGHLQGIIAGGWLSFLITAGSTAVWPRDFN